MRICDRENCIAVIEHTHCGKLAIFQNVCGFLSIFLSPNYYWTMGYPSSIWIMWHTGHLFPISHGYDIYHGRYANSGLPPLIPSHRRLYMSVCKNMFVTHTKKKKSMNSEEQIYRYSLPIPSLKSRATDQREHSDRLNCRSLRPKRDLLVNHSSPKVQKSITETLSDE